MLPDRILGEPKFSLRKCPLRVISSEPRLFLRVRQKNFTADSGAAGANPHFFFLPPVAENTPDYNGIQDDSLKPTVTVCYLNDWEPATETYGGTDPGVGCREGL
jgi:hypothetical protein